MTTNDFATELDRAIAALDGGDVEAVSAMAARVRAVAQDALDPRLRGRAWMCLASIARLTSRIREGHRYASQAVLAFRAAGDESAEAGAHSMTCYCAAHLAHNEEAIEAGVLGARLRGDDYRGPEAIVALNNLGLAYSWAEALEEADDMLTQAIALARSLNMPGAAVPSLVNRAFVESIRQMRLRYHEEIAPATAVLDAHLADAWAVIDTRHGSDALPPGSRIVVLSLWHVFSAVRHAWAGALAKGEADVAKAEEVLASFHRGTWMDASLAWARSELCWRAQEWAEAERHAANTVAVASAFEHEQFARVGTLVQVQLLQAQGKFADALQAHRALRAREAITRRDSLASRRQVVQWQLDARRNEHARVQSDARADQFERISLEDPLTGLANRRCFEAKLAQALQDPASLPLSVALIDIDNFKSINDHHSHLVGDMVLKRLAQHLRRHAREEDLPVRLAGDEFVVFFCKTALAAAEAVCGRIGTSLRTLQWSDVSPTLTVTVSIGCAQWQPGDDGESLLDRADAAMYAMKRQRGPRTIAPPSKCANA